MSELEDYRDYADRIAAGDHKPDCRGGTKPPSARLGTPYIAHCPNEAPHAEHEFGDFIRWNCPGRCDGCYLGATQEELLW